MFSLGNVTVLRNYNNGNIIRIVVYLSYCVMFKNGREIKRYDYLQDHRIQP